MKPGEPMIPAAGEARDVGGPRSLTRLLQLFDVLAHAPAGMSLAELNAALDTPKSSLLNLLRPLVADGYLVHVGGNYRLGLTMFRLASHVLSAWEVTRAFHPYLEELRDRTGETAVLAVLDRSERVLHYADVVLSPQPIRFQVPIGTMRPLHAAAAGRVLLAFDDPAYRQDYLANAPLDVEMNRPVNRKGLEKDLVAIAEAGYVASIDQYIQGLASFAAPAFASNGRCIAALAICGPSERMRANRDECVAALRDVAKTASGG